MKHSEIVKVIRQQALVFLSCNMDEDIVENLNQNCNVSLSIKEWEAIIEAMLVSD